MPREHHGKLISASDAAGLLRGGDAIADFDPPWNWQPERRIYEN
jgi:hypothetical protein